MNTTSPVVDNSNLRTILEELDEGLYNEAMSTSINWEAIPFFQPKTNVEEASVKAEEPPTKPIEQRVATQKKPATSKKQQTRKPLQAKTKVAKVNFSQKKIPQEVPPPSLAGADKPPSYAAVVTKPLLKTVAPKEYTITPIQEQILDVILSIPRLRKIATKEVWIATLCQRSMPKKFGINLHLLSVLKGFWNNQDPYNNAMMEFNLWYQEDEKSLQEDIFVFMNFWDRMSEINLEYRINISSFSNFFYQILDNVPDKSYFSLISWLEKRLGNISVFEIKTKSDFKDLLAVMKTFVRLLEVRKLRKQHLAILIGWVDALLKDIDSRIQKGKMNLHLGLECMKCLAFQLIYIYSQSHMYVLDVYYNKIKNVCITKDDSSNLDRLKCCLYVRFLLEVSATYDYSGTRQQVSDMACLLLKIEAKPLVQEMYQLTGLPSFKNFMKDRGCEETSIPQEDKKEESFMNALLGNPHLVNNEIVMREAKKPIFERLDGPETLELKKDILYCLISGIINRFQEKYKQLKLSLLRILIIILDKLEQEEAEQKIDLIHMLATFCYHICHILIEIKAYEIVHQNSEKINSVIAKHELEESAQCWLETLCQCKDLKGKLKQGYVHPIFVRSVLENEWAAIYKKVMAD